MTGGGHRSRKDLLNDRLHQMDAVEPPEPDFEFRALRADRERLKRRQAWTRGLVGAAAAVVIGAVAIPSLGRINVTSGGSSGSAVAGAASTARATAPKLAAPEGAAGSGPGQESVSPGSPVDGMSLDNVPDSLRTTFAQVRSVLAAPPYDPMFTSLTFDPTVSPAGQVVVHLTRPDAAAIAVVQSAFAGGPDVVVETSPYSLASCRSTWTTVAVDPQLRSQAATIVVLGCDANGRVAVRLPSNAPAPTVDHLRGYGDAVYAFGG